MEVLGYLVGLVVTGFIIGAIARFALPGPDPMPAWMTVAFGLVGSVVGTAIAAILHVQTDTQAAAVTGFALSVVGATLVLLLYRRVVQRRPLSGPDAQRLPLRARGLRRIATRQPHRFDDETRDPGENPIEQLRHLVALRDAGKIGRDEFERRKARLVDAI